VARPCGWDWIALLLGAAALARRAPIGGRPRLATPSRAHLPRCSCCRSRQMAAGAPHGRAPIRGSLGVSTRGGPRAGVSPVLVAVARQRTLDEEFAAKIRLHNQNVYTNQSASAGDPFTTALWIERPTAPSSFRTRRCWPRDPPAWVLLAVSCSISWWRCRECSRRRRSSRCVRVPLVFCALSPAGSTTRLVLVRAVALARQCRRPVRLVAMVSSPWSAAAYAFEMASPDVFPLSTRCRSSSASSSSSGSSSSTFASPCPSAAVLVPRRPRPRPKSLTLLAPDATSDCDVSDAAAAAACFLSGHPRDRSRRRARTRQEASLAHVRSGEEEEPNNPGSAAPRTNDLQRVHRRGSRDRRQVHVSGTVMLNGNSRARSSRTTPSSS